jgi:hypothetical protein
VETARAFVLKVLEVRFGKDSVEPYKETIALVRDSDDLAELHSSAIKCRTLGGFRRLLARKLKSQPTS